MNMDYTSVRPVSAGRLRGFVPQKAGLALIEWAAVLTETLIFVGTVVHAASRSAAHHHLVPLLIGNTFPSGPLSVESRRISLFPRCRGFTLVELMIALTVAAILLAIAIPRFNDLAASHRLSTTASSFLHILGTARSEAIKRNADVIVGLDGSVTVTTGIPAVTTTLRAAIPVQTPVINLNIPAALTATAKGMLTTGGTVGFTGLAADVSSTQIPTNNHRCVYVVTGMTVMSCTDSTTCAGGAPSATCK